MGIGSWIEHRLCLNMNHEWNSNMDHEFEDRTWIGFRNVIGEHFTPTWERNWGCYWEHGNVLGNVLVGTRGNTCWPPRWPQYHATCTHLAYNNENIQS